MTHKQSEVWHNLGLVDADWAVLTEPGRRWGGWAGSLEEFYESGRKDVTEMLALAASPARGRVLDFGSGTGRLSFALAEKFGAVTAADVSDSMLNKLERRARAGGRTNITPVHVSNLLSQPPHDLCISLLVLQHLETYTRLERAVQCMVQSLAPAGRLIIEVPERALTLGARLQPRYRLYRGARRLGISSAALQNQGISGISMLTVSRERMARLMDNCNVAVVSLTERWAPDYLYIRYVGLLS